MGHARNDMSLCGFLVMPDEYSTDPMCFYCTRSTSMKSVPVKVILVWGLASIRGTPIQHLIVVVLYHLHIFDTSQEICPSDATEQRLCWCLDLETLSLEFWGG